MPTAAPTHVLDNPAWHALAGPHAGFALVAGGARRYPPDMAMFTGVEALDAEGWADLARLAGPGGSLLLTRSDIPEPPPGWRTDMRLLGGQMVLDRPVPPEEAEAPGLRPLTTDDVPAMLALTGLTRPGPFFDGTIRFGGYVGVERDGRLLAMAGRRMALPGYTEVSAVCVHPDAAGQGLGAAVTLHVARSIQAEGATPILHVAETNDRAFRLYERLGFTTRMVGSFVVVTAP